MWNAESAFTERRPPGPKGSTDAGGSPCSPGLWAQHARIAVTGDAGGLRASGATRPGTGPSGDGARRTGPWYRVTSGEELANVVAAYRVFERWWPENFFKCIATTWRSTHSRATAPARPIPIAKLPTRRARSLSPRLREARADVARLARVVDAAGTVNEESKRSTMRGGFKIANASAGKRLREADESVDKLREELRRIPERVSASQTANGQPLGRLKTETELKSAAYQARAALLRLIRPRYRRQEALTANYSSPRCTCRVTLRKAPANCALRSSQRRAPIVPGPSHGRATNVIPPTAST
jgi:hypothetical protein